MRTPPRWFLLVGIHRDRAVGQPRGPQGLRHESEATSSADAQITQTVIAEESSDMSPLVFCSFFCFFFLFFFFFFFFFFVFFEAASYALTWNQVPSRRFAGPTPRPREHDETRPVTSGGERDRPSFRRRGHCVRNRTALERVSVNTFNGGPAWKKSIECSSPCGIASSFSPSENAIAAANLAFCKVG